MKRIVSILLVFTMLILISCGTKTAGRVDTDENGNKTFTKADGTQAKDEWIEMDNKWYYFGPNSLMAFNCIVNGAYYVGEDGSMVANYWYKEPITGNYFYFGDDGQIIKSSWVKDGDDWFYLEANGMMAKNKWIEDKYYVNENGKMEKNTITPDGYIVGADGKYIALPPVQAKTPTNVVSKQATVVAEELKGPFKSTPYVGQTITFGKYQGQKIVWVVLDVKPGKALCFAKQVLDYQKYNEVFTNTTWATSTLRVWLNSYFIGQTFSANEKSFIFSSSIFTGKNTKTELTGGASTRDSMFLLSAEELKTYENTLAGYMCATATKFAKTQTVNQANTSWWTRTPGTNYQQTVVVNTDGTVDYSGAAVDLKTTGVRPAMWVLY